jgi:hypothetical protein
MPMDWIGRIKEVRQIVTNQRESMQEAIRRNAELIEQFNRGQLLDGKRADGTSMPNYVANSKQPEAPGPIKLKDTGAFQEAFDIEVFSDSFEIDSQDEKSDILKEKYGVEIFGLNQTSRQALRDELIQSLRQINRSKLHI